MNYNSGWMCIIAIMAAVILNTMNPAYGHMMGNPYPNTCGTGSVGTFQSSTGAGCPTTGDADASGQYMWGKGAEWTPGTSKSGFVSNMSGYVITDQNYFAVAYICVVSGIGDKCDKGKSYKRISSALSVRLKPGIDIEQQSPIFGGPSISHVATQFTKSCYTLVGVNDGQEYTTTDVYACDDVTPLPPTPPVCMLNTPQINVEIPIDRNSLTTAGSESQSVSKRLSITCTGEQSVTYTITLTPSSMFNTSGDAIKTNVDGLNIAVYFDNKLLTSVAPVQATYSAGTTDMNLKFVPKRDPLVPTANIPTGPFQADAVMILSEE